ncbi:unnamed protein product [Adineta steineri]|uniref:CAP-Gly domain-containing protein n=1 Tax=Adineta steineri TaxID=433720 RepID=A0A813VRZ0_9BILA|nr:unnamed protein product [Adineta steineri]CAF1194674.1 unnamed protein product [Adineta steineri]
MDSSLNDTQNDQILNQLSSNTIAEESIFNLKISNIYLKEIDSLLKRLICLNKLPSIVDAKVSEFESSFSQYYLLNKFLNDDEQLQTSITHLKQEFKRIYILVYEANKISNELQCCIDYNVILQIPVSYLKSNERVSKYISSEKTCNFYELVVQVKRQNSVIDVWNIEEFECRLSTMKDIYDRWKKSENKNNFLVKELKQKNVFYNETSKTLIGVANIYLKPLFYNSKVDYTVPIINTKGETSGSLNITLDGIGSFSMNKINDFQVNTTTTVYRSMSEGISADMDEQSLSNVSAGEYSLQDEGIDESISFSNGTNDQMTVKFSIKEARGLPPSDTDNVMCRYTLMNAVIDQTVVSVKPFDDDEIERKPNTFSFIHEKEFTFPITNDFLSTHRDNCISIEVYYQYKSKLQLNPIVENNTINQFDIKTQEINRQWKHKRSYIQCAVEIHEFDDVSKQWQPIDAEHVEGTTSGGIYRLKQDEPKRLVIDLRVLPKENSIPLSISTIQSVEIGSISKRRIDAPIQLDSYQDKDLQYIKDEWLDSINKRRRHIKSQIKYLSEKTNESQADIQMGTILLEKLEQLAIEHNIALVPPVGSGIPGASITWNPPISAEERLPLILLNLDPFTLNKSTEIVGDQIELSDENMNDMCELPLVQNRSNSTRAIARWDLSTTMNQVTPDGTIVYLIVKIIVMISEPVPMKVVLRKRIAVIISKQEGWLPTKMFKNILGYETSKRTSVFYEIISTLPKSFYEIEDQNQLDPDYLSQNYIEKCVQYASSIDSLLLRDNLRQQVLLEENCVKQQKIRKVTSVSSLPFGENEACAANDNENENYSIDSQVIVNTGVSIVNKPGIIRYIGKTIIKNGIWYGIELEEAVGKNNGSYKGEIYFECADNHGTFVRRDKIKLIN